MKPDRVLTPAQLARHQLNAYLTMGRDASLELLDANAALARLDQKLLDTRDYPIEFTADDEDRQQELERDAHAAALRRLAMIQLIEAETTATRDQIEPMLAPGPTSLTVKDFLDRHTGGDAA